MRQMELNLEGLQARIENAHLVLETARESQYCGRELAIARAWQLWLASTQDVPQVQSAQTDQRRKAATG